MNKRIASLLVGLMLIFGLFTLASTANANVTDTGINRTVELTGEDADINITVNQSLPETISENHTLSGTVEQVVADGAQSITNTTITVTVANDTYSKDFTSSEIELTGNESATYDIEIDVPEGTYNKTEVSFSTTGDATISDSETEISLTVKDNVTYMMSHTLMYLIISFIPLIIVLRFVIPILMSVTKDTEDKL